MEFCVHCVQGFVSRTQNQVEVNLVYVCESTLSHYFCYLLRSKDVNAVACSLMSGSAFFISSSHISNLAWNLLNTSLALAPLPALKSVIAAKRPTRLSVCVVAFAVNEEMAYHSSGRKLGQHHLCQWLVHTHGVRCPGLQAWPVSLPSTCMYVQT